MKYAIIWILPAVFSLLAFGFISGLEMAEINHPPINSKFIPTAEYSKGPGYEMVVIDYHDGHGSKRGFNLTNIDLLINGLRRNVDSLQFTIDSLLKRNAHLEKHHNTTINHAGDVYIGS